MQEDFKTILEGVKNRKKTKEEALEEIYRIFWRELKKQVRSPFDNRNLDINKAAKELDHIYQALGETLS